MRSLKISYSQCDVNLKYFICSTYTDTKSKIVENIHEGGRWDGGCSKYFEILKMHD